jgi:hypothetical protein
MLGDVTGNGEYSAYDASLIARVAIGIDSGFDAFGAIDPMIVSDISDNGGITGFDAAIVARNALKLPNEIVGASARSRPIAIPQFGADRIASSSAIPVAEFSTPKTAKGPAFVARFATGLTATTTVKETRFPKDTPTTTDDAAAIDRVTSDESWSNFAERHMWEAPNAARRPQDVEPSIRGASSDEIFTLLGEGSWMDEV